MYTLKIKCKTITPLFMAGADGKTPELRPSEFKGMMRWWWRAIRAEDNIDNLRKEEAKIFGGAGENEGKSRVKIKIMSHIEDSDRIDYQPLPHHQRNNCPVDNNTKCNKAFFLKAIKVNKTLDFEFTFIHDQIENLIYLMFILGGFGKRARRGFGSLQIIEPNIEISLVKILELLNKIKNTYEIDNSTYLNKIIAIKNKNSKNISYPFIKEIIIGKKPFLNENNILKAIGLASHNNSNPALGSANPRMASPIYVSIAKINNKLYPIITILNSCFPNGYPNIDPNKIKNFLEELIL